MEKWHHLRKLAYSSHLAPFLLGGTMLARTGETAFRKGLASAWAITVRLSDMWHPFLPTQAHWGGEARRRVETLPTRPRSCGPRGRDPDADGKRKVRDHRFRFLPFPLLLQNSKFSGDSFEFSDLSFFNIFRFVAMRFCKRLQLLTYQCNC